MTAEVLSEVREYFALPSDDVVEKDYHVVRALTAVAATDPGPFTLAFAGGTSLARAHRVVARMSEDVDIKVVSRTGEFARPELRLLRERLTDSLLAAGFDFDPTDEDRRISRNQSRYTRFNLPYPGARLEGGVLRSQILLEISASVQRRPYLELPVTSFVAEALRRPPEVASIPCCSIVETAAEKLVALTRRTAAALAGVEAGDPTLVRHVYDLRMLKGLVDEHEVGALAREIVAADAEQFGGRHPQYKDDPQGQTRLAISALAGGDGTTEKHRYEEFLAGMVYGERPPFEDAIRWLRTLVEAMWAE